MRRVFSILFLLFVALTLGLLLHRNPGLVVVSVSGWRVDMPLWFAVAGVMSIYVALYCVVALINWCLHCLQSLGNIAKNFRENRAKVHTEAGFKALTLGEYHDASKLLYQGAASSEFPWINYLFAAKAAQAEGDLSERDRCLAKATHCLSPEDVRIRMTACEFALQEGEWDKTLSLLLSLEKQLPRHPHVITLLKDVYLYQENWSALQDLMPKIKRAHILSRDELTQLQAQLWHGLLHQAVSDKTIDLTNLWQEMPRPLQSDPELVDRYVNALIVQNKMQTAEKTLQQTLDKHWDDDLVKLYGQLEPVEPKKTLATLEKWLKTHMDSPPLLAQCGQLCDRLDQWEKAQRYYEASISLAPSADTFVQLGAHWEKLNRADLGEAYFKKALQMTLPDATQG